MKYRIEVRRKGSEDWELSYGGDLAINSFESEKEALDKINRIGLHPIFEYRVVLA